MMSTPVVSGSVSPSGSLRLIFAGKITVILQGNSRENSGAEKKRPAKHTVVVPHGALPTQIDAYKRRKSHSGLYGLRCSSVHD